MPKHTKSSKVKNSAAAEFGRIGGLKGGKARMSQLSPEERSALASKAAKAGVRALTAKERSEKARAAVLARWAKQREK